MNRSHALVALASLVLTAAPACVAASGASEQAEPAEQSPRIGTAEAAASSLTLVDDFTSGSHFERLVLNSSTTTQTGSMLWGARSTQLAGSYTPSPGAWGGLYINGAPSSPLLTVSTSNPVNGALVLTYVKPTSKSVLDLTSGGTATRLGFTFLYNVGTTINPGVTVFDDVHGNRCEGGINVFPSDATSFPAYIDFSSLSCVGADSGVPTWHNVGTQVTRIVVKLQSEAVGCDLGGDAYALTRIMACSPTQCG
jgi:hypothetical protein